MKGSGHDAELSCHALFVVRSVQYGRVFQIRYNCESSCVSNRVHFCAELVPSRRVEPHLVPPLYQLCGRCGMWRFFNGLLMK
jgi:hypothetical protein